MTTLLLYIISNHITSHLAFMVLISQYPFSSILWHRDSVPRLVVHLALLELVVQLENGLPILLDRLIKVGPSTALQT